LAAGPKRGLRLVLAAVALAGDPQVDGVAKKLVNQGWTPRS
jgi:hypothetical protein